MTSDDSLRDSWKMEKLREASVSFQTNAHEKQCSCVWKEKHTSQSSHESFASGGCSGKGLGRVISLLTQRLIYLDLKARQKMQIGGLFYFAKKCRLHSTRRAVNNSSLTRCYKEVLVLTLQNTPASGSTISCFQPALLVLLSSLTNSNPQCDLN